MVGFFISARRKCALFIHLNKEPFMARTIIGLNDAKAVKRFSGLLAVDIGRTGYFNRKFMGTGPNASTPIQMLPQLENDAGEQITYD